MKKKLILGFALLLILTFGYFGFTAISHYTSTNETASEIPPFRFVALNGEPITPSDLLPDQQVIIVYANPNCEPCTEAIRLLATHRDEFQQCQIVLVFPFDAVEVERFIEANEDLNDISQLKTLLDPFHQFSSLFGPSNFPAFFIYGKRGELLGKIEGLSDINLIREFIEK